MSDGGWTCSGCQRRVFLARVWDDRVECAACYSAPGNPCVGRRFGLGNGTIGTARTGAETPAGPDHRLNSIAPRSDG